MTRTRVQWQNFHACFTLAPGKNHATTIMIEIFAGGRQVLLASRNGRKNVDYDIG
jgi:hypothetical protein